MNATTFTTTNNTTLRCTPFIWETSSYTVYTIIGCKSAPCQLTVPSRPCQHLGSACRETFYFIPLVHRTWQAGKRVSKNQKMC